MVEASLFAWLLLAFCCLAYSTATVKISRLLPWETSAYAANLPFFAGLALAPFLFGMIAILALGLFPHAQHATHLWIILIAPLFFLLLKNPPIQHYFSTRHYELDEKLALLILIFATACLFFNAIFFPLTQNDSLEYATVGRTLFETRNLMDYAVLTPATNSTGFYAPWTHPPLYVSLIYATYLIQAHDNAPGLMRIISPWFALLSVILTYAIGSLIKRRVGLFAATLLISTPILFLGADSGLIDPLPMLGLLLIVVTMIGFKSNSIKSGILQGSALGLALWTHSQAILFIPLSLVILFLMNGGQSTREILKQVGILLITCAIISFLPYTHNLQLFGVLISDNNPVYALTKLRWHDYFKYARELNTTTAVIQYGILKGWFMLEFYGITFWLMSLSFIYFCYRFMPTSSLKNAWLGIRGVYYPYVLVIAWGIVLTYLAGVVISVLLGIDLMIRNERYLLVIFPYVALLSAWFYAECIERKLMGSLNSLLKIACVIIMSIFPLLITIEIFTFVKHRVTNNCVTFNNLFLSQSEKLSNFPNMMAMNFLNRSTPPNSIVLSTQPADMYYAHRKMVSYLDPRLIPFYSIEDPKSGAKFLKKLGISYVHVTDYSLPVFYNSILMATLADPASSTLLYSVGATQVYRLNGDNLHYKNPQKIDPMNISWIKFKQYVFMQNKGLLPNTMAPFKNHESKNLSDSSAPLHLFQRNFATTLMSEKRINVEGGNEYVIDFSLFGEGYLDFFILQFDKAGIAIKGSSYHASNKMLIGNLVLNNHPGRFIRRIKLLPNTHTVQIGLEQHGNSSISIENATLTELKRS